MIDEFTKLKNDLCEARVERLEQDVFVSLNFSAASFKIIFLEKVSKNVALHKTLLIAFCGR